MISDEFEKTRIELATAKSRASYLLSKYPLARNSDNLLCEVYYREFEEIEIPLSKVKTPVITIVRVRRDIQRNNPLLAPTDAKVKEKREQKSKKFKKIFGEEKNYF
jgi:hypothetical protein